MSTEVASTSSETLMDPPASSSSASTSSGAMSAKERRLAKLKELHIQRVSFEICYTLI